MPYGEHLFQVLAVGEFGTPDSTPAEFEWVSGTDVAPDVTITSAPPATGGTATTGTFEFGSTDPDASFLCTLDGGPELPCSSPFEYTDLLAGEQNPHTFEVTATKADLLPSVDARHGHPRVGRSPTTPLPRRSCSRRCRRTRAATRSSSGSPAPTTARSRRTSRSSAALDGGRPVGRLLVAAHGSRPDRREHTFEVRAIDETLLTDPSPASHTWNVIAPPLTTITNEAPVGTDVPAGEISTSATGELSFFDQPGSTYECRLDAVDPDVDPFDAVHVAVRVRPLQRRARVRGQGDDAAAERAEHDREPGRGVHVDDRRRRHDGARTRRSQLGPANPTTSTSATFLFSGTDNLTAPAELTFECSLDGAAVRRLPERRRLRRPRRRRRTPSRCVRPTPPFRRTSTARRRPTRWTIVAPGANNTPEGTNVEVSVGGAQRSPSPRSRPPASPRSPR